MGCCMSRDIPQKALKDNEKCPEPAPKPKSSENSEINASSVSTNLPLKSEDQGKGVIPKYEFITEAISLKIQPLTSYNDSRAEEILNYCENIQTWIPVKETDWMTIEKIDFSQYNKDYPMTHTKIYFGKIISIKLLILQLNSPDHRPLWDTANKHWEILSGNEFQEFHTYRQMNLALLKADFTDKRIVGLNENYVVVIAYGVEGLKEEVKGFTRGFTSLNVHKIYLENGATVIENFQQIDAKSAMAKAFAGLGPPKLIEWGKALVKRVNELHGSE